LIRMILLGSLVWTDFSSFALDAHACRSFSDATVLVDVECVLMDGMGNGTQVMRIWGCASCQQTISYWLILWIKMALRNSHCL
jgi:hypothetical protein